MSKTVATEVLPDQLMEHRAVRAWNQLQTDHPEPTRIEILKLTKRKSAVYRVHGVGPDGRAIIAKRCPMATAEVERMVYAEFLPRVSVPALRCYGSVKESEDFCWLFLEDAVGEIYSPQIPQHRALAGRWLGAIHLALAPAELKARLPDRGLGYYLKLLRHCRATVRSILAEHVAVPDADARMLRALEAHCEVLESRWSEMEKICKVMPPTLVHDDFVVKNVRIKSSPSDFGLLVFDWEYAGWGAPGPDLAQFFLHVVSPDLSAYCSVMKSGYPHLDELTIQRVAGCGTLLRLVDSMFWATKWMGAGEYRALAKGVHALRVYQPTLIEQLRAMRWS
jgi:hypothetical protein